jgi:plastocyanin
MVVGAGLASLVVAACTSAHAQHRSATPSAAASRNGSPRAGASPSAIPSPTFAPVVAPASCHPATTGSAIRIQSKVLHFSTTCIGATSTAPITITYRNLGGTGNANHNVAIYRDPGGLSNVFRGGLVLPGHALTYRVGTLAPGVYLFECDLHPFMKGYLVVR